MTRDSAVLRALHVGPATAVVALCFAGCAGGNSDTSPTVTPQGAGSSPPPSTGNAVLNWSPVTSDTSGNTLPDLAGYKIHYGTSESTMSDTVVVDDPQQTTYTVAPLAAGTWYFSVNAFTTDGVDGLPSNTASKTIE